MDNNHIFKKRKFDECEIYNKNTYVDQYAEKIYAAGETEVHFSAHIDVETISKIKKVISNIINKNQASLVVRDTDKNAEFDNEDHEPFNITYIVNSGGGCVTSILDFVDYIRFLRLKYVNIKFTSIITGLVASAGTIMCIVADERKMTKYAHAMIHELSAGSDRINYTRIISHADFVTKLHNTLVNIYVESIGIEKTDYNLKDLEAKLLKESWMTADEYKNIGFVSTIL